jgi:hypothetical protein
VLGPSPFTGWAVTSFPWDTIERDICLNRHAFVTLTSKSLSALMFTFGIQRIALLSCAFRLPQLMHRIAHTFSLIHNFLTDNYLLRHSWPDVTRNSASCSMELHYIWRQSWKLRMIQWVLRLKCQVQKIAAQSRCARCTDPFEKIFNFVLVTIPGQNCFFISSNFEWFLLLPCSST